ncbi:YtxH domain-containing protein [Paenibacillus sp. BR2-3]|uniref:YtxH domain-containing protein n=1 Tax=Paenibacillus sp. BR2-3 TaxID=3048494 RepID=UPI003977A9F1
MKKNNKGLLWGVVAGSIVGSVTALLLAPKAGKELRKDIADGASTTLDKAQEIAGQAGDKSVELYDKAKEVVIEVREWGKQHLCPDEEKTAAVSGIIDDEAVAETVADVFTGDAVQDDTEKKSSRF